MKLAVIFFLISANLVLCQVPQPIMQDLLNLAVMYKKTSPTYDDTYPTNIPGYSAYGRWVAGGTYYNGATLAWWTNLVAGTSISLSNQLSGAGFHPTFVAGVINGFGVLSFDGTDNLRADDYSIPAQPLEVFVVMAGTNTGANAYILGTTNAAARVYMRQSSAGSLDLNAGSGTQPLGTGVLITNRFYLLNGVVNGANSTYYTNGFQGNVVNPGVSAQLGFTVGSDGSGGNRLQGNIAEIITYSTNLGAINSAGQHCDGIRSNVTYTLMTKYALIP